MDVGLVCDQCSTFNPMGTSACTRCEGALALESNQAAANSETQSCPACNEPIPLRHRFCGACGCAIAPARAKPEITKPRQSTGNPHTTTMFFGAMQKPHAKLVVIRGDGIDGLSYSLAGEDHIAGRGDVALSFVQDPHLSPEHANFFYKDEKLYVRDLNSVNGIYIRTSGTQSIESGDRFLVGEQILEIRTPPDTDNQATPDGTYVFASPSPRLYMNVVQLLRGGDSGFSYSVSTPTAAIGRSGNTINFPDDPFISGKHAKLENVQGKLQLTDLNSRNGTFLRIRGERILSHGDYVFLGQQLLRVEIV